MKQHLLGKFQKRAAHVAVIGLGYVGLPLAVSLAEAGYRVTGVDVDHRKIEAIKERQSYIADVPSAALAALPNVDATLDYAALADCDAVSICVPTPLNRAGDREGASAENGRVRLATGFTEAYRAFVAAGWGVGVWPGAR